MFCVKCGAPNPNGANFCSGCGQNLTDQPIRPRVSNVRLSESLSQTPGHGVDTFVPPRHKRTKWLIFLIVVAILIIGGLSEKSGDSGKSDSVSSSNSETASDNSETEKTANAYISKNISAPCSVVQSFMVFAAAQNHIKPLSTNSGELVLKFVSSGDVTSVFRFVPTGTANCESRESIIGDSDDIDPLGIPREAVPSNVRPALDGIIQSVQDQLSVAKKGAEMLYGIQQGQNR